MNDLVSIIVPVYNVEKFIRKTMDTVRAQTYEQWELLLIEDGSTDNTVEVIESYLQESGEGRIRLIRLPENAGAAGARNVGMEQSKGRYVTYLDADDLWRPEKLKHQLEFMSLENCAFSYTGYEFADENGQGLGKIVRVPHELKYREALGNTTIFTSTVMFDTTKIPREQLMMPLVKSEDTALWWQILRQGYTAYGLDENLVYYRRAGKSLSSNKL
ncbi:MAG: glycosyltransferase family 2 protein, partial [Lachnospiraceae bacterium]|nr:glycosyltransferase family 2 protein [Lachnospiraceae bacterium]